jgi:hypothetical protein
VLYQLTAWGVRGDEPRRIAAEAALFGALMHYELYVGHSLSRRQRLILSRPVSSYTQCSRSSWRNRGKSLPFDPCHGKVRVTVKIKISISQSLNEAINDELPRTSPTRHAARVP